MTNLSLYEFAGVKVVRGEIYSSGRKILVDFYLDLCNKNCQSLTSFQDAKAILNGKLEENRYMIHINSRSGEQGIVLFNEEYAQSALVKINGNKEKALQMKL